MARKWVKASTFRKLEEKIADGEPLSESDQSLLGRLREWRAWQDRIERGELTAKEAARQRGWKREKVRKRQSLGGSLKRGQIHVTRWPAGQVAQIPQYAKKVGRQLGKPGRLYLSPTHIPSGMAGFHITPPFQIETVWEYEVANTPCACECGKLILEDRPSRKPVKLDGRTKATKEAKKAEQEWQKEQERVQEAAREALHQENARVVRAREEKKKKEAAETGPSVLREERCSSCGAEPVGSSPWRFYRYTDGSGRCYACDYREGGT